MSSSKRIPLCLAFSSLTLALAAYPTDSALAQQAVETYIDQAVPDAIDPSLIPEGMTWNKPLKAGDMVLPRLTKPKESASKTVAPASSRDGLKAPKLAAPQANVQAPKLAGSANSTQSIMLLQGMKTALQQSGQNTDVPKSDIIAIDPSELGKSGGTVGEGTASPKTAKAEPSVDQGSDVEYVKGQEPKGWGTSPKPKETSSTAQTAQSVTDIVFPPEMSGKEASVEAPKATELAEQPMPLETVAAASQKKKEEPGLLSRMAKPFTSIFGEPVKDDEEKKPAKPAAAPVPATETPPTPVAAKCDPTITSWNRECSAAGYPAHFVGKITGETRVTCPSGESKDVWLSNTCAAPIASSAYTIQEKPQSDLAAAPASAPITKVDSKATSGAMIVTSVDTTTDGACGTANGLAIETKPAGDLCAQGDSTPVLGDGPWRWSCKGRRGGMTVSCAAPVLTASEKKAIKAASTPAPEILVQDGKCGEAEGVGIEVAPSAGLCAKGTASRVNGNGPWTWACSGANGGSAAACMAPKKTDGICGEANGAGFDGMPTRNLCTAGYASAVTGEGPWNWTCSGLYGGNATTCSATTRVNGICGPASMKGHRTVPQDELCNVGTATGISGNGPWSWTCKGASGGATVRCAAPIAQDGECGASNGAQFEKAPNDALCAVGAPTRVTGTGPWAWNCTGSQGGDTASCTAMLGSEKPSSEVACGEAAETLATDKPKAKLCKTGTPSSVEGNGPWSWSCDNGNGGSISCATLVPSSAACGAAAGVRTPDAPTKDLCQAGEASSVEAHDKTSWKWTCKAAGGQKTVECSAPMATFAAASQAQARCGAASGMGFGDKPDSNLCETGKASALKGNGPWTWTCSEGKTKDSCEALRTIDGACGKANGSLQRSVPNANLCLTGKATDVTGNGPWMWSCVGVGGGSSASCSAASQDQTKVDGACGSAASGTSLSKPDSDLCDSGMPSNVHGEGPWTWTCSGMNGGIAATCGSSRLVPKAPPPPGPAVNGVCGFSNGVAAVMAPDDGLCSSGMATALSGSGPWNWSCIGANGGMTVSCTSPLQPPAPIVGECGSSTGVPTLTKPKGGLCSAGIASAVSGKGPWTWSCSGTNGGGAVSCVAPLAGKNGSAQPMPSLVTPSVSETTDAPTPRAAPVGLVTPQLPSSSLPAMKPGTVPDLKVVKKDEVKKGKKGKNEVLDQSESSDYAAPSAVPELPEGIDPLPPPPVREESKPKAGLKPPVLDSEGKAVVGSKLALEPDVSTITFASGSDQLDKDAVDISEKLTKILMAHGNARITLTAYADTAGNISPREARRLSLNRALAIRDFMTSKGLSSSRVDIRPMGANVPSGDMDRVDVKVN